MSVAIAKLIGQITFEEKYKGVQNDNNTSHKESWSDK